MWVGARARGGSRQAGKAVGQARGCACGGGQQHVMLAMLDVDQDFFPAGMGGGGVFLGNFRGCGDFRVPGLGAKPLAVQT